MADNIIERIHSAVKKAGYEYAKSLYNDWQENFADEIVDEESHYYQSVDENGHPFKEIFSEQIDEQAYHTYCSGTNDDFFSEFAIDDFSKEERDLVEDDDLYDVLWEGIEVFIKEIY